MEFKTITFEEPEQGIGLITLNRPDRLNAINLEMLEDLRTIFYQLRNNENVRVVIITGAGRGFCSGADLKDLLARKDDLFSNAGTFLYAVQKKYSETIIEMHRIAQPIIGAVNGVAAGGGMCIALASDVIFATPSASFVSSFINIGLSSGELGSTYFLPRAVGLPRAAEILFTGRPVKADEAERIGLISKLVKEEDLMDTAMETARIMLSKSRTGLLLTKEALYQNLHASSLEAAVELENRNQSICVFIPEFLQAVEEFDKQRKK